MQKSKAVLKVSLCLVLSFLVLSSWVEMGFSQEVPHLIRYERSLADLLGGNNDWEDKEKKDKKDKEDKDEKGKLKDMTFRIYNVETGGLPLWEETHLDVSVNKDKGEFKVILGNIDPVYNPLDLKFDEDYWLGIEVENEGEIEPREKMTSVGYAYMAEDSYRVGGRLADDLALMGHSHVGEDIVSPVAEAVNADNADKVDNIHASNTPLPNQLFSLDSAGKFPAEIISGQVSEAANADMVDGFHAADLAGVKDHGELEGLADDDHLQYLNEDRGDERYGGAGWDGTTKLENSQLHIADKENPHEVNLEQLGYEDNNPEEEAPTETERGEPTGTEIQQWADDIAMWGHTDIITNLNADMLDGKHAKELSKDNDWGIYEDNLYSKVNGKVGIGVEVEDFDPTSELKISKLTIVGDGASSATSSLHVASTSDTLLFVRDDGNIGIGTGNPREKLEVAGNVKAEAFIGDGSQLTGINGGQSYKYATMVEGQLEVPVSTGIEDVHYCTMPDMSVTHTFSGNPVKISFVAPISGRPSAWPSFGGFVAIYIDGIKRINTPFIGKVKEDYLGTGLTVDYEIITLQWLESLSAGTHTIEIKWNGQLVAAGAGPVSSIFGSRVLIVEEL